MTTTPTRAAQAAAMPMTDTRAIPIAQVTPWAMLAVVVLAISSYFVGSEQGATSFFQGSAIHEFVHDARHLLGFPCH